MKNILLVLVVAIGFGCSPRLAPDAGWGRGRWVVVEMKGVPVQQSGGRRDAFLEFDVAQKRVRGNGGCNQLNGGYSVEKSTINFTGLSTTKMSCTDIAFETTFLSVLGDVNRFETRGDDIILKRKKEVLLVLRAR